MSSSFSIIIPTYNREKFIGRALKSALSQCGPKDEVIVVDDGSQDDTARVVAQFGEQVRYHYTPNGGAGLARNIGISLAQKQYVAFLDSDDEWFAGKLELHRRLMDARPEVLFSFSDFAITRKNGEAEHHFLKHWITQHAPWHACIGTGKQFSQLAELPPNATDFSVHICDMSRPFLIDICVLTSSLVVRRAEAGEALCFAADLPIYEDWFCFAQLSRRGLGAYLNCETAWQHGQADARVSDANAIKRANAWLSMNDRIWAKDAAFKADHSELWRQTVESNQLQLARSLIRAGRTKEAREILASLRNVSAFDRLLSLAPGAIVRGLVEAKRRLRPA